MANKSILTLNKNQLQLQNECYSELFDLKTLENMIKEESNNIELYTCFNCINQMEYICKWCKNNCHGKNYHVQNNHIKIKKMTKIQIKNIKNFNCICKEQKHIIRKNSSYKKLYEVINNDNSNFSSKEFYNSIKEIIKEILKNNDYDELFDLLFFLKNKNIVFKKIFEYNDKIWKDLIKINDDKIRTKIIFFYFELYINDYFIIDNNEKKYKKNLLFWFYDKSFNNKNIIYNYFIYDIIIANIKIINKLNIIQPISFLKKNNISTEVFFNYLLKSDFIYDIENIEFLLWNLFIKYSSFQEIENNNNEKFNLINLINCKESKFILIKTINDLEIFEDFLKLGFTQKIPFISKKNILLKRLLINLYNENNKYLFNSIKSMFSNNKIITLNEINFNKNKLLFILYYYSNKNKFLSSLQENDNNFDINNISNILSNYFFEYKDKTEKIDKFYIYQKIEELIIDIYKYHKIYHIKEQILDKFFEKSLELINLIIKDEGKYYFINSHFLSIMLKFIVNDLQLKKENHLNHFFSFIDILKLLPKTEIELTIRSLLKNEILKNNFKKKNISLLYYFLINPEIEEISFLNVENYENLFNEMSSFYLSIFEINRIEILIKYFEDYDLNISINELVKNIIKKVINKDNKFYEFSLKKFQNKDNTIIQEELNDMNENNIISDIYILYFIKSVLSLENKFIYLNQNLFIKFHEFLNFENKKEPGMKTYNNIEIIKNEKIPICIKSLLLKFILKLGLTLKIDKSNNILRPLTNKQEMIRKKIIKFENLSSQEKIDFSLKGFDEVLRNKIYEEHYLVIKSIFNIFNEVLEKLPKKNFPNSLNEYCIVILKGLKYFSNMLLNSYDIFYLYFKHFEQLINNFYKNENIFLQIFNKKESNKNNLVFDKNNNMDILKNFILTLEKYSDLINEKNCESIYDNFYKDNNDSLFPKKEETFLCFFENNYYNNITLEEFNNYSPNNGNENLKIFSNYMNWVNYNDEIKEFKIIKILTSINIKDKEIDLNLFHIFLKEFYIRILSTKSHYILNYNEIFILIKIFKLNKEYIDYGFNSELSIKTENEIKNFSKEKIPIGIIGKLIKSINYYCNYEISISNSFCNSKHENIISRYVNSLIILLTLISDKLDEYIFNYSYDFTNDDCLESIPDKNLNSQNEENKEIFYNDICSPYECMVILYQKIYESLIVNYSYKDKNIRPNQNNLLILFYSITNFLISFNPSKLEKHKNKISFLLNKFFKIHLNQNIFKFIDNPSYTGKEEFEYFTENLFIKNQLIKLFVTFIQLNNEKALFQSYLNDYKYEINIFLINDLLRIIESIIKSNEDNESIILYRQNKSNYCKNSNLFYKFLNELFKRNALIIFKDYTSLIFLYYKAIKIFVYNYNYNSFKILFDGTKNENENEFLNSTPIFFQSKLKVLNLIGLFKFLNSIYIEIDFRYFYEDNFKNLNKSSLYVVKKHSFFMNPNCSILSAYFKEIFLDKVNRTSRLNKINFLNYFIDIAVYDCIYKKYKIKSNKHFRYFIDLNFKILEHINIAFVTFENLYLLIEFYKDIDLPIDEYNFINSKNYTDLGYSYLWVIVMFHSLFLGLVLACWGYFYFYRYYFHSLRKFFESKRFLSQKLSLDKRCILFRRMFKNKIDFENINFKKFFPYMTKKNLIEIAFREILFLNHKSWALYTFIFTIGYYFSSPFPLIVSWIFVGNFFPSLLNVFRSLKDNFFLIFSVYFYSYALVYILTWAVFFYMPKFFTLPVANKDNEILDKPEAQCSSTFSCLLYFLNYAMVNGGYAPSNLTSFKSDVNFYLTKFFIEVIFFQLINWIFTNIVLALVTNAFETFDRQNKKNEYDKNTKCFICEINYKKCFENNINFKEHCKIKHSIWNYLLFIVQIITKDECEMNHCEKYVFNFIKNDDFNWLPYEGNDDDENYISPLSIQKKFYSI